MFRDESRGSPRRTAYSVVQRGESARTQVQPPSLAANLRMILTRCAGISSGIFPNPPIRAPNSSLALSPVPAVRYACLTLEPANDPPVGRRPGPGSPIGRPRFVNPLCVARGRPLPLGISLLPDGVNFALLCRHGTAATLVLSPTDSN